MRAQRKFEIRPKSFAHAFKDAGELRPLRSLLGSKAESVNLGVLLLGIAGTMLIWRAKFQRKVLFKARPFSFKDPIVDEVTAHPGALRSILGRVAPDG